MATRKSFKYKDLIQDKKSTSAASTGATSVSSKVSSKINPAYSSKEVGKEIKSGNSLATGTSRKRYSSPKKTQTGSEVDYWQKNALELYKEGRKQNEYDSTFSKDFFLKTPEAEELLNVSIDNATAMQALQIANTIRQIQAGDNYRTISGDGADYTRGASQYGNNDENNRAYQNWMNRFYSTATEEDVGEGLKFLQKAIEEAGEYDSDYKTRRQQDYDELKKWAGNTYSSFATMELNDYDTQIARNNIRIRELGAYNNGLSESDAAAAQTALGLMLSGSGDPIATVQNNKDLRRITDYDNLAKQYSDPYELGDAIIDSLMNFNDRAGSSGHGQESYDEYVRLAEENDSLRRERAEVEERRNSLLEREKYAAMPGTSTSNTSLSHFHPEPYEVATRYSRRNMETGENESFYEYNSPTLAQMVADPEGVWEKYQQASAHSSVTGSANDIDLVMRMTDEERDNYKKVYAGYGEAEADKYFDVILRDKLNARQTRQLAQEHAAAAEEHSVAAYLGSLGTNLMSRINDIANAARIGLGMEPGQNQWGEITNAQLNTVYQKAADATPWANFDFFGETANPFVWLLQGAQAAGQEALDAAVFGPLKNVWMGLTAGSAGVVDNYEKYGDRGNAFLSGLGTAAAEFGSEWLGDKVGGVGIFKNMDNLDSGLKKVGYLAKGTIGEGIEEGLSNVIGTGLDAISGEITGVGSEVADRIRYLKANGYTQTEAWNVLAKEYTPEVLQDVIVGAIAGAGMSGSNVAATTAYDNSVNRQLGAEIQQQGNVSAVLSMGLQSEDPGVKRVSENLMKKLNLTDPNQPILPNDSETNAQLNLVKNSVSEEQQAKDSEKKQANAEARMGEDLEEAVQERKQVRAEEQAASDLNKKQAKEEQRAQTDAAKAEQKAAQKEDLNLTRRQKKQVGQVYRKVLNALDVDVEARRKDLRTGIEQKRAELAKNVDERLRRLGERPIKEVSEAIAAVALDDPNLTIDQLDIAEAYAARKGVVKDLWDVYARTVEQRDTYAAATSQKLDAAKMRTADMVSEMKARAGDQTITAAGDISYTTDEGDTITGKLESFAAAENGDVAAVVGGKIVPVDRLEIGDEGRDKLLRYAAELRNPDAANAMYEGIEENQDVDAYASGFEAAYHYGEIGIDIAKAKQRATVDMLTPKQFESAYVAGASAAAARPKTVASKVAGKISFADGLGQRLDGLDANQKGAISVMRRFAEVGSVNIEFFESQANAEGSYAEYENGSYNPDTNTIRIDINAGKNKVSDVANYAMLRVASHELTHYIKAQNAEAYQKLQDFVVEHLSAVKNTTFDALVELKMQQQPKLSYEAAVEEVVADGSEMMLKNSTVIQQLAIKDKSLFQRVRDWLRNFAKNVQAAFRGVSARSAEARLLQNVKGMQKLWDNALLGAIENVRSAQTQRTVAGTEIDTKTQTASIKNSRRSLEASEYAKDPDKMAASLAKAVNVSEAQAKRYIKNMFSIGKIIAGDQTRLDYEGNPLNSVLKDNAEYKFTVDMSTLCAKRLVYTGTLDAIQNAMPNTVLTSEDLVELRKLMMDRDYEVACGICYVESRRRELGSITKGFVDAYNDALASGEDMMLGPKNNRQAFPTEGGDMLTLADVNTTEGIENIQLNHPKIYAAYMKYMNSRGVSKPKLIETRTDYRGEILDLFNNKRAVKDRNDNGGLRIQSFSDFEVVHLIDMMQVITDMAQVGLSGQAYTKVPDFAEAMGRTGLKINLSLIAKGDGVDADGNLIFDDIEGMPAEDAFRLRKKYSKNVGTILVGKSDEHIRAALADPRIDFVIPFHKSGWSESLYAKLGLQNYSDYTNFQNERAVTDSDFKWDHSKSDKENYAAINKIRDKGRHVDNLLPMDYWDFNLSGEENARNYLEACYYDGRLPKFPQFVNEPGYWKLLIDFKMYDNNGNGSPQLPVKPDFNMTQARRMLKDYNGGHTKLPVAQDVVDDFVKQYKESHSGDVKYSIRESSDGFKYVDVDADQAQFDGLSSSEKRKLAEKIIRSKFVGKVIGTDYKVYVNGTGANEYAYPAKFIQDPVIIDAKMRAAPELENLIDAGFNFRTEKDGKYGHTHANAVDGFTHFDTVFHVAGEYYIGRINVINGKRGKLFKDLTQIKSIVPDHVGSSGQIALANIVNNASGINVPQVGGSVKSSMRTDSPTDRDLLVEAFEGVVQNDTERGYLEKYKGQIEELNEKQIELAKIRREIRDMMFTPGERDSAYKTKLADLKSRANNLAEAINRADKRLLMLEKAKPLQDVLARERQKAEKKAAEKRRESLTAMRERRETTEIRHKIRRLADDFNRRLIHPTEKNYIPRDMVHMVIAAQELVDTRSGREGVKAQEKLARIKAVYDRYKGDSSFAYVYDPMIADMLQKLSDTAGSKNIYQLNKAELTDIYNTLKALRKQVTEAVKLKAGTYAANIIDAGREMYRETNEAAPAAKGKLGDYLNWQLTPDKFFARLAGYKKGSVWNGVAKSFSDGTEKMLEIQREAYYHFRKWTESKEFDKLNSVKDNDLIDIGLKDESGNAVKITRGMMLEVYMHLSSEDNMRGFMYGGFSVPNLKKYYAGKVAESYGTGSVNTVGTSMELAELAEQLRDPDLTEAQQAEIQRQMDEAEQRGMDRINTMRATIENKMTAWDRGLIEAVHRWNDGNSRDHINDVTMDLYGIKRAQVDNYYPIHRDKAFVNSDFESISRNVNLENWGSLKDRVPSRAPILLGDIAFTLDTSVNQMSRYVGYARAQRDFSKLYNVRMPGMAGSVKKIIGTKFGSGTRSLGVSGEQYIENYIGSITGSRHAESDFLSVIRRNLPRATMTLNARVAFSQLSAIPKAAAEVGWDSVASGLARGGARAIFSKKAREELAQQNAWFWQRYRGEGGQREFTDIKGGSGIIDKAWNKMDDLTKGWLLNWCQDFDIMSTVSMWSMAKEWARKHTSFKEGTAEFTEAANRKYTDILRNTQAANTVSERSDLARETKTSLSLLTMYKSEAFANFNMIYDAAARLRKYSQDAKAGKNSVTQADVKQARNQLINSSISVVVGASLTNAILKLAVNALTSSMNNYRDEDDEITLKSTLTAILNEVLNDIASMVTFGGETYDLLIGSKIFGETYYAPSDMALSEIIDTVEYANTVFSKEDATIEDYQKAGSKIFTKVCNMLGVPYNNVKRQAKGLMDTIADIAAGEAFSFEASADRSNGTNYRRMLKASIEGDDTKYASVLAELEENGVELADAQEGYRDKLKEAFEDGEIDRDRAIELMTDYGGKSADDAYWAVDKWEYSGEDSYSKYGDLRAALAAGNRTDAEAAVEELLNHGVKEENLASQISTLYGNGEATSILALQLRPGRLYTPSVKEGQEDKKDDFNAFMDAVLAGKDVEEEISKLRSKGYSTKKMMSALNGAFGKSDDRYAIMAKHNPAEAKVLEERILDAYVALGLNREQERTWIHENWTMPEEE